MLKIRNFTKVYGEKRAVDALNLVIEAGEICGFIGHNGAGKTTTLKACMGILSFEEGEILIDGMSIKEMPLDVKRITAYIPDNPDLYDFLTGEKYLAFVADVYGVSAERRNRLIKEYADIFEITVHDQTETKAYQHGAIYIMPNGKYYYVCFEDLDNSYFDADGYFSYRMGSVPAYELDEKSRQNIDECIASMTPKLHEKIFEEDLIADNSYDYDYYDHLDPNFKFGSIVCFFAITIIVGIMIPAALIVLGIVFARSKKTNQAKCWYALSASAALWLLSALLFLILVII